MTQTIGVAIIGCGYVADYYMTTFPEHPDLTVLGVWDHDEERLERFAAHHEVFAHGSMTELLEDDAVEIVVNLTDPRSHAEVTRSALEAGKHVYSEKPLATELDLARALVELSEERGLHLSSAPCSLLGETAQTLWKSVREGAIGTVRAVYAELDEGLVHRMPYGHWVSEAGAPWPYQDEFEMGTVIEHAGYIVTWLPAMFGPVASIAGFADCLIPDKSGVRTDGTDFSVGVLRFESGVVARVTCSLVAPHDHSLRIIGDDGVLSTDDTWFYDSPVYRRRSVNIWRRHQTLPRRRVSLVGRPTRYRYRGTQQMDFARGVADLADAIRTGAPDRACQPATASTPMKSCLLSTGHSGVQASTT